MRDWDDLRIVLAIARARGLPGAARALGVNISTVFRRLGALEEALGVRLFDRLGSGYMPTEAGRRMAEAAERMEQEALALGRELTGRDARLSGRLRVTASETLSYRLLTRCLAEFHHAHPGIRLELAVDNRLLSLTRREADVALRATRPREASLYGRKLADIAWTAYASPAYLAGRGCPMTPEELAGHAVIGWEEGAAAGVRAAEWLASTIPDDAVIYRSGSLVNQMLACREGIGVAVLPCYLGDPEPGLRRLLPPIAAIERELWLITHDDLRHTARVRAFLDRVGDAILRQRPLLEGHAPPAAGTAPGNADRTC